MFVYELSGCGFESRYSHLNFRFCACFEQGVPWHSGNDREWIHSEMHMWHDKSIQLNFNSCSFSDVFFWPVNCTWQVCISYIFWTWAMFHLKDSNAIGTHNRSSINTQPFSQTGQMIELCCEFLPVRCLWLYLIIISRTSFKMNLHSIVPWMSKNSLFETGAISEV